MLVAVGRHVQSASRYARGAPTSSALTARWLQGHLFDKAVLNRALDIVVDSGVEFKAGATGGSRCPARFVLRAHRAGPLFERRPREPPALSVHAAAHRRVHRCHRQGAPRRSLIERRRGASELEVAWALLLRTAQVVVTLRGLIESMEPVAECTLVVIDPSSAPTGPKSE